ncbi:MAG: DNA-directed RNA polymerase subunit omega [Clostridiaceae bacterium]|nr:DNA-directed RNA polymerase subunit omega [Clostridiaceae bacterium]MBW4858677.1 DNA-directed RNA polymerase subunit omega [Clostridiaceae bacterium]MBW4868136.1 DNA-directed RNA polymerase subunit omega [Clostridiaceae bacterium]
MLYPSINEITKKADSRYTLVMLAAKRARQLVDGNEPYIDTDSTKPVSVAIEEIAEDKISYKRPDIKGLK